MLGICYGMQAMGYLLGGEVVATFRDAFKINLIHVDATKGSIDHLQDVTDPETKRKRIGNEFITVTKAVPGVVYGWGYAEAGKLVMTADWARLPYDLLGHISSGIINEVMNKEWGSDARITPL